jgi:uncharacterized membrane protein
MVGMEPSVFVGRSLRLSAGQMVGMGAVVAMLLSGLTLALLACVFLLTKVFMVLGRVRTGKERRNTAKMAKTGY